MASTPPASTLRDGNLKATIWQNEGDKGAYYSTTLSRTYKDERGEYQETQSFSPCDLLRVAELARQSFHEVNDLRQQDYDNSREDRASQVEQRLQNNRNLRSRDTGRDR